jgi:hypothetical protein
MTKRASNFLAKRLVGLLWYISEYADFEDFSPTTRRDFFQDFMDEFHAELTQKEKKEVLEAIRSATGLCGKRTYYGPRFERFLGRFVEMVESHADPVHLQLDGRASRKKADPVGTDNDGAAPRCV